MKPFANMLNRNGYLSVNKPTMLFCLISSMSLFSTNALAQINDAKQSMSAQVATQGSLQKQAIIKPAAVDTPLIQSSVRVNKYA